MEDVLEQFDALFSPFPFPFRIFTSTKSAAHLFHESSQPDTLFVPIVEFFFSGCVLLNEEK